MNNVFFEINYTNTHVQSPCEKDVEKIKSRYLKNERNLKHT